MINIVSLKSVSISYLGLVDFIFFTIHDSYLAIINKNIFLIFDSDNAQLKFYYRLQSLHLFKTIQNVYTPFCSIATACVIVLLDKMEMSNCSVKPWSTIYLKTGVRGGEN